MHSTISMGQVGLAFSRRQKCLKIGTFKDIKVWSSQGLKRRKFPDVIHTDRQKTDYFRACALRLNNPLSRTSTILITNDSWNMCLRSPVSN